MFPTGITNSLLFSPEELKYKVSAFTTNGNTFNLHMLFALLAVKSINRL